MIPVLRDAGLSALIDSETLQSVANGLQFTEGPLWRPDGSLLFQDLKAERTYRVAPDGVVSVLREQTGAANGQAYAPDGRIVFCEQNGRRVSTMLPDGTDVRTLAEEWSGKRLNSPNDVVCHTDGSVYFTDPPYGVKPEDRSIPFQGVYRIGPDGQPVLLADDFEKPNGLAFSPDEATLYVCDTGRYHVRSFALKPDGTLREGSGAIFCTLDPGEAGGPDGMKVDRAGRVYVAVALGIWVYEADGTLIGILGTPSRPSNLNWCGPDFRSLAITMGDTVLKVRLKVEGVRPPFLPA
ncbi:SMP-30/gluconolactonase/LRE family protein [Isosphaeraceae bacterium EP7]